MAKTQELARRTRAPIYPYELRLYARKLFLLGKTHDQIVEVLKDEKAVDVSVHVVENWSKRGRWTKQRIQARVDVERRQVEAVRRELGRRLRIRGARIERLSKFLEAFYDTPVATPDGTLVRDGEGKVVLERRTPENSGIELPDLVNGIARTIELDDKYTRAIAELVGGGLPHADPVELVTDTKCDETIEN